MACSNENIVSETSAAGACRAETLQLRLTDTDMPMPVYLIAGDADLDTALNELSCDLPGCKEPRAPRPQSDAEGFASRGSNDRYYFKYCKRTHALAGRIIPRSVKTQHQEESAPKCCRADCNEPAFIEPTLAPEGYNEPVTGRKHGFCCLTHFRSTVERGTCMRPARVH